MTTILRNQKIWVGGYDLTGHANSVAVQAEAEMKDATVFGDDTRRNRSGLKAATLGVAGHWNAPLDLKMFQFISGSEELVSVAGSGTPGDPAYMMASAASRLSYNGQQGEIYPYDLQAASAGKLLRGKLVANSVAASSGADGTAYQIGAVAAGKKIYAGLHVLSAGGTNPTLDVTIESDSANDFSGAETSRITFTQADAVGAELQELAGAITDQWWRATWAISGDVSPLFNFSVILAIA